jgi:CheY-like chemotaxis protein
MGALFGLPAPASSTRRSALILTAQGFTFAATCDKVIGARQIVVRRLPPLFAHLRLYAGATISGAGKVQLILDVARLAELARQGVHEDRPAEETGPPCVLVVDDSRAIQKAAALILGAGGFTTETVGDGFLAWERLQDRPFHALVTDLEMPRCDGWELIQRVRQAPELGALPIVVVSSRAEQERERALAIGADVVVKKPLGKKTLLDAVGRAVSARKRAGARRE